MATELLDISISKKKPVPQKTIFKPRVYDDGSVEVQFADGRRMRQIPTICAGCGRKKIDVPFGQIQQKAAANGLCVECLVREDNERRAAIEEERALRLARGDTSAQRRYVAFVLATPMWRDRAKIKAIYEEAYRRTRATGIQHEVDHIYPIQSKYACGLHVHQNLQILEKFDNRSKKNDFPLFGSPCGVGVE